MTSRRNLQYLTLEIRDVDDRDARIMQGPPTRVMADKSVRFEDANIHGLDRASQAKDSLNAGEISAEALGAWLYGCVKYHVGGQDFSQSFLGHTVLLR